MLSLEASPIFLWTDFESQLFAIWNLKISYLHIAGCFKPGENGMILKKSTDKERECLTKLMKDILRPYIPEYRGEVNRGSERILDSMCSLE